MADTKQYTVQQLAVLRAPETSHLGGCCRALENAADGSIGNSLQNAILCFLPRRLRNPFEGCLVRRGRDKLLQLPTKKRGCRVDRTIEEMLQARTLKKENEP